MDGILRVFIGGQEIPGSPIFSDNGPNLLKSTINKAFENDTLNFILLAPESSGVVFEVELNPVGPNQFAESNSTNNTGSTNPMNFQCKKVPNLAYAPIDYRPGGGSTPNVPSTALIKPGVGDNFIQGIFPTKDWFYHRTDAPSKLWTGSLSSTGSSLLNSLSVDLNLMNPKPDFLYGWVPGSLPYNGQAFINGKVSMGNTQSIRHQRTFAHELGHNFGLNHNSSNTNLIGVDVEHHLNQVLSLPQIKSSNLKDIMVGGQLTNSAWVRSSNYNFFFNDNVLNCSTAITMGDVETLLIAALLDRASSTLEVTDVLTFEGGEISTPSALDRTDVIVRAFSGGTEVYSLPVTAQTSADECEGCTAEGCDPEEEGQSDTDSNRVSPIGGFVAVIPAKPHGMSIDRVDLVDVRTGNLFASEVLSSAPPKVTITAPVAGSTVSGEVRLQWSGSDADGDELQYYVRYSPNGNRMVPIANALTANEWTVDLNKLPEFVTGSGYFEVLATDGLHTTSTRTSGLSALLAAGGGNVPFVNVMTPDTSTSHRKGATVILHSSGWDLEDNGLDGTSIVWTSNVDGFLANGRLTTVTDLSVGTHVLTVRAIDSGGLQATDSVTINILDRGLPQTDPTVCQADLGFGGPGSATLSVCGGNLSSGTTAELLVSGAMANQPTFVFFGFSANATSFMGGTLLPIPVALTISGSTNAVGELKIPAIPGGGGPFSVFAQAIYVDSSLGQGVGITNAVRINILQ